MKVIVVGGGAAGMMAAYSAAVSGNEVILIEKNEKLGKKLYITGKGRCNFTNNSPIDSFFTKVPHNPKFLYSSFNAWNNLDMIEFLKEQGVEAKVERGERVFPVSDHSSDVIKALRHALDACGVRLKLNTAVNKLIIRSDSVCGVITALGEEIEADHVILACGGASYPSTGSDGSGFLLAKEAGHSVSELRPALVPLICDDEWMSEVQGLSLRNVRLYLVRNGKMIYSETGEMLFTGKGVSGPIVLGASSLYEAGDSLYIDLKPALDNLKLDARLLRDFEAFSNKDLINGLDKLLPKSLIPVVVKLSGIDPHKKINRITAAERSNIVTVLKHLYVSVRNTAGFNEAIITRGGISVKEINPGTMHSKLVSGLSFAGEMIDVDAFTGGYNLQIAWSTGYLAGLGTGR